MLKSVEPDQTIRATVQEAYNIMNSFRNKYFNKNYLRNPLSVIHHLRKGGMIIYINHTPNSALKINGKDAVYLDKPYSIYDYKGQEKLEEILRKNHDGAVEVSREGIIKSYRRMFSVVADDIAAEIKLVRKGEDASYKDWGFKKPVFSRHKNTIAATAKDPNIYGITLSEETGDIRIMRAGKILYSTIPEEVCSDYHKIIHNKQVRTTLTLHHPTTLTL